MLVFSQKTNFSDFLLSIDTSTDLRWTLLPEALRRGKNAH